jgi:hypothetical protein
VRTKKVKTDIFFIIKPNTDPKNAKTESKFGKIISDPQHCFFTEIPPPPGEGGDIDQRHWGNEYK